MHTILNVEHVVHDARIVLKQDVLQVFNSVK